MKICFSLCAPHSERSSLARPSSWGPAPWSWPSWWLFSFQRSPRAPPLPPSCPSVRSPTQMAKSQCQHWPACTSTHLSQAAMKKVLPPQTMRTLSRSCRTVLFEWKLLWLLIYKTVEFKKPATCFLCCSVGLIVLLLSEDCGSWPWRPVCGGTCILGEGRAAID